MKTRKTREPQYQIQVDRYLKEGPVKLGLTTSHLWRTDPRHLGFLLARYKFCAKMLTGKENVLEVGCGDGFGISIVLQNVSSVHAVDFDPLFVENAQMVNSEIDNTSFQVLDMTKAKPEQKFEAVYSLDVIEHIPAQFEKDFMDNCCAALVPQGVLILGTPNIHASQYGSVWSQEGHVNMKDEAGLRNLLLSYFHNVFIFSMSDEVIHSGFYPMAHYLLAIATGLRTNKGG